MQLGSGQKHQEVALVNAISNSKPETALKCKAGNETGDELNLPNETMRQTRIEALAGSLIRSNA